MSVGNMSMIECCPPHIYECLWCHYFRTMNIVTLLSPVCSSCVQVVTTCHKLSQTVTPYDIPVTDWVYWTSIRLLGQKCKNLFWQTSKNVRRFIHAGFYCSSAQSTKFPACIGVSNFPFGLCICDNQQTGHLTG